MGALDKDSVIRFISVVMLGVLIWWSMEIDLLLEPCLKWPFEELYSSEHRQYLRQNQLIQCKKVESTKLLG